MLPDTIRVVSRGSYICFPLLAFVLCLYLTRNGINTSRDSDGYLAGARSFASHGSLLDDDGSPLTHFPVLLPVTIGTVSFLAPTLTGVRYLNALLAAISVFLLGRLCAALGISMAGQIGCMTFAATNVEFLHSYTYVWSEPFFSVLLNSAILLMLFFQVGAKIIWSAVALGLACLTRYAGVYFIAPLALTARRFNRRSIALLAIYIAVAAMPITINLVRNVALTGHVVEEQRLAHYKPGPEVVRSACTTMAALMLPGNLPQIIRRAAGSVAVVALISIAIKIIFGGKTLEPHRVVVGCLVWYSCSLLFSSYFLNPTIMFDGRMLTPVFPMIIALGSWGVRYIKSGAAVFSLVGCLLVCNLYRLGH